MSMLDVAVIGAGPAGLAAATGCAEHGLSVSLYDEQAEPGGQIYRGIAATPLGRRDVLGEEYWAGGPLVASFRRSGARYVPDACVWSIARNGAGAFDVALAVGRAVREPRVVIARAVILATGALERPFPVRGWTLPGVMTAGGAQILLKTAGLVPGGRVVLAGCGPLLWLAAAQLLRAGARVEALLDTTPAGRLAQALPHAPAFIASPYFAKGLALVRYVRRRVRVVEYVDALALTGDDGVQAVRFAHRGGGESLAADHVLLHQGVVPDVNLAAASGCALEWNDLQACFAPVVDAWGGSSVTGLYVAGDGAGIAGAVAARARGELAALAAANALGRMSSGARDRHATKPLRTLARSMRGRRFLDVLYRPADAFRIPAGETLACRCEEVPAAMVARLAREGCAGPNQMKAFTRCGMGPCQGRYCGLTVTEIIASAQARAPGEVGYYRLRAPAKPVTLAELAAMPVSEEALRAVERE